jgi:UDP-perosamine 4-acetyltransferase
MPEFEVYGVVDETLGLGESVLGAPVVGRDSGLRELNARGLRFAVLGVGAVFAHATRAQRLERLRQAGFELPNVIHPRSAVDASVKLGCGNVVFANATISASVTLGSGCIINSGAVVSHDCRLGDNIHLAPGALLAGGVRVGDDTLVGMGVKIFVGTRIGRGVRISNGANVDIHVPDGAVVKR